MPKSPADVRGRIFISYRREDAAYPAGWLFDRLAERFGIEQIFKDVDSIELGDDFVEVIGEAVGSTDVLLALIGEKWLAVTGEDGGRRLDNPDDFVRLEIEAALTRKVRVIPILVEGATMPKADELPPSLTPLARRQALELSPNSFTFDTDRLLAVLERTLAEAQAASGAAVHEPKTGAAAVPGTREPPIPADTPPEPDDTSGRRRRLTGRPRLLIGVAGAAVLAALLVGGVLLLSGSEDPPAVQEEPGQEAGPEAEPATDSGTEPAPGAGDAVNGEIAFISDRSGENEIWSLRPGDSDPHKLTRGFADVGRPDWSPDGTKVAFGSNRGNEDGNFDLWILDTEDGSMTPLTHGPADDEAPEWSPDGSEIAFERQKPGTETDDIWIMDVESGSRRQVTDDPADDDAPDWSSTDRIAFGSDRDGDFEIYTLDPAGLESDVQRVTDNTWQDLYPAWSPDGRRIAYRSSSEGDSFDPDIYTIDAQGNEQPQQITDNGTIDRRPSWSPDGTLIAFESVVGGQTDLYVVPWDGGKQRPLIAGPDNEEAAAWGAAG